MPFNQTIPQQSSQPSTITTTSQSPHSGLSIGAKAAIGITIPVVFLAALSGFFWFWRKRKISRTPNELDGSPAIREMDANTAPKELNGADRKRDYDSRYVPHELESGVNSLPPIELG
jgi:hypothetical protein